MQIWVDADGCPRAIKEILFRASDRTGVSLTLVANSTLSIPRSPGITAIRVQSGSDVADQTIVDLVQPGDLVITADIILASHVIQKSAMALSPRGNSFDEDNIGEYLSTRTMMSELRSAGLAQGGPPALSNQDRQRFANRLETILLKRPSAPEGRVNPTTTSKSSL